MTRKEMQQKINARNALSPEQHIKELNNFVFDLQLFGKSGGKKAGKILLTAGAFFFGAGHVGMHLLGATHSFASGIMAASLVGTIWNVAASRKIGINNNSSPSIQRFDKAQEGMSGTSQIPVVYGMRKICGNQTFHETNAEQNTLHKHVVLCEGGIEGIVSVCANDLLIPTGKQAEGTVFTIQNVKYKDAKAWKDGKTLHLYADGKDDTIYLCNKDDAERADTYYEWQANTSSLISYINRMHKGWQAFPYATTSKYPGDLRLDDTPCYMSTANVIANTVKGGTTYTFHDCEPPENFEEVGGYPNMAWLDMSFQSTEELNGNPSVDCVIKGRKIYDPRTKKTAYSNNPALCVLDFLTNKRYGLGRWVSYDDIDIDSFIESANYCDQEVTVYDADDNPLKSKRYTLDMIIDERQDAAHWLQDMLSNFSAWLVISKDKIKLMVEQPSPIVHRFNDDNITSMTITPIKASETPNHYEVSLCDPLYNNWRVVQVVHDDYADQKQRGKVISKTVELSGVTSQSQALRLAQFYSDYNLSCPIMVSFTTGIEAMALEPGDVISISYRDTFVNMPVRISEIKETAENEFEITARQYNADIYGDDLSGGIQIKTYVASNDNSDEDSPYFALANVKNLKAISQHRRKEDGSVAYDIVVSFDLPQSYNTKSAKVYYKNNHVPARETVYFPVGVKADDLGYLSDWKCAGETSKTLKITNVKIGDVYKIRAAVRTQKGKEQKIENCPEVICKVTKRATVPPQPHNLTYDFSNNFVFSWDDVEDSDVMCYELRLDTQKGQTLGMLAKTSAPSATVKLSERKGKAYVYALNQQGNYSYPASCNWSYPKPDAPDSISFSETPIGMRITLPFFPAGVAKARLYITGADVSDKIDILNPIYEYKGQPSVYSLRACYVDRIGEGYSSKEYSFVINPTFKPEWIADESISVKKMDKEAQKAVADAQNSVPRLNGIDSNIEEINTDIEGINTNIEGINTDIEGINTDIKEIDTNILGIKGDITELVKADGEIRATITKTDKATNERFASQLKQTADSINATVAKNKKDQNGVNESLASQIEQTATEVSTTIQKKLNNLTTDITNLSLKADGISSTVVKNKTDQDGVNKSLASQIAQKAGEITATVESKEKGLRSEISKVSIKADGISSTVSKNKTDQDGVNRTLSSQIVQKANEVKTTLENRINGVKNPKTGKLEGGLVQDIAQVSAKADGISSVVVKNKTDQDGTNKSLASQITQKANEIDATIEKKEKGLRSEISNVNIKADGISSTVAAYKRAQDGVNTSLASQITQKANSITAAVESKEKGLRAEISKVNIRVDGITSTVSKNKTDQDGVNRNLASQITQKADEVKATLQNRINGTKNPKTGKMEGGLVQDIAQVSAKADGISSVVVKNKTDQDGTNKSLASQINQKANEINATIQDRLDGKINPKTGKREGGIVYNISQVSLKADGIRSTVTANKTAQDKTNTSLTSQITQKANEINATIQNRLDGAVNPKTGKREGGIVNSISQVSAKADNIKTTLQNRIEGTKNPKTGKMEGGLVQNIAQVDAKANSISSTVQTEVYGPVNPKTNKREGGLDGRIKGLSSKITQEADRITSVITNLGKTPNQTGYSAITQLQNGINARVSKTDFNGKNIVSQINMTAMGTTIDGKYLHITGTTKIDNNVIVGGMIKSGSISADKLSAGTMSLTGGQGIKGGAALLNANGLTVSTNNGSVAFDSQGMSFKDKNGQAFSVVGRFLTGVAKDGQYVKFTKPWDVNPNVIVIPTVMQTGVASYSASNTFTKCYAENVSKDGFKVRCYSCLGAGSSGMVGINKVESVSIPRVEGSHPISEYGFIYDHMEHLDDYGDITVARKVGMSFTAPIPKTATSATIRSVVKGFSHIWQGWNDRQYRTDYRSLTVVIEYLANGKVIATDSTSSNTERTILRNLSFPTGSTIFIRVIYYFRCKIDDFGHRDPWSSWATSGRSAGGMMSSNVSAKVDIESATLNVNTESVIANGTAVFLVTDSANKQYTVS